MRGVWLYATVLLPVVSDAAPPPARECAAPGHYVEGMLLTHLKNDLGIDLTTIRFEKTTVDIVRVAPVSELFARQLAAMDSRADMNKPKADRLSEKEYFALYYNGNVQTVTATYTLTNINNQRDIFISSALVNDEECSIRYNGYLTIARGF